MLKSKMQTTEQKETYIIFSIFDFLLLKKKIDKKMG